MSLDAHSRPLWRCVLEGLAHDLEVAADSRPRSGSGPGAASPIASARSSCFLHLPGTTGGRWSVWPPSVSGALRRQVPSGCLTTASGVHPAPTPERSETASQETADGE